MIALLLFACLMALWSPSLATTHSVRVFSFAFEPSILYARVGDTVLFNFESGTHQIQSGSCALGASDGNYESLVITSPGQYALEVSDVNGFNLLGPYLYHCGVHLCSMGNGQIVLSDALPTTCLPIETVTWTNGSATCSAPFGGANTGNEVILTSTADGTFGTATAVCVDGVLSIDSSKSTCILGCKSQTITWQGVGTTCSASAPNIEEGTSVAVQANPPNGGSVIATCTNHLVELTQAECVAITAAPTECIPPCNSADLDRVINTAAEVDAFDLSVLLANWGPCDDNSTPTCTIPCGADLNRDTDVNDTDLGILLAAWGPYTCAPTASPTDAPTESPTDAPTESPTGAPTESPTDAPTQGPTETPTTAAAPSEAPTTSSGPTTAPSPTESPTAGPTTAPSPTESPTAAPTASPTESPTNAPTTVGVAGSCAIGQCPGTCQGATCNTTSACGPCQRCDPASGSCVSTCVATTCNPNPSCVAGVCVPGAFPTTDTPCDDSNSCTTSDHCNGFGQCTGTAVQSGTACGALASNPCLELTCQDVPFLGSLCLPRLLKNCSAPSCQLGVCDIQTGACTTVPTDCGPCGSCNQATGQCEATSQQVARKAFPPSYSIDVDCTGVPASRYTVSSQCTKLSTSFVSAHAADEEEVKVALVMHSQDCAAGGGVMEYPLNQCVQLPNGVRAIIKKI